MSTGIADKPKTVAAPERELTLLDRCDRCGAQAYLRAVLKTSGSELFFCGHHARAVEPNLRPLTSTWQDETQRLHETSPRTQGSEN